MLTCCHAEMMLKSEVGSCCHSDCQFQVPEQVPWFLFVVSLSCLRICGHMCSVCSHRTLTRFIRLNSALCGKDATFVGELIMLMLPLPNRRTHADPSRWELFLCEYTVYTVSLVFLVPVKILHVNVLMSTQN